MTDWKSYWETKGDQFFFKVTKHGTYQSNINWWISQEWKTIQNLWLAIYAAEAPYDFFDHNFIGPQVVWLEPIR